MKYEVYGNLKIIDDFSVVDFKSTGRNGDLSKRIVFQPTDWASVYNLAFGDVDDRGEINDFSISHNGDRNKVLATVAAVVKDYTLRYPERVIYFSGSTGQRTRLYRMAIALNLAELAADFDIYGLSNGDVTSFNHNENYEGFFVKRKNA